MSQAAQTGLFALAGVIVGGLVTGGADLFFQYRQEAGEERQATRLIAEEIRTIWIHLDGIVTSKQVPSLLTGLDTFLPTARWHEYGPTLALRLHITNWDVLSPFMGSMDSTRLLVRRLDPGTPLAQGDLLLTRIKNARDLAAYSHGLLTGRQPVDE